MVRRRVQLASLVLGVAACVVAVGLSSATPGCYDEPQPACGFQCGANAACPDHYTCSASSICRLDEAPAGTVCSGPIIDADDGTDDSSDIIDDDFGDDFDDFGDDTFDADGIPFDGPDFDAPDLDAPVPDAMPDAAPDAMPDAPPDAMIDAMPDAPPVDAMPDA